MFVYNLTIKVTKEILPEWIIWIREKYIPGIMVTGLFNEIQFFELIDADDDLSASTFVLQHFTDLKENYNKYLVEHSPEFIEKMQQNWEDNFITFSTLMHTVR